MSNDRGAMTMDREWLLCNGRGGFASGTMVGVPTRRYHGLLCTAARPPLERWMLLNAVLEKLSLGDDSVELANFEFDALVHPRGYEHLIAFDYDLAPEFSWVRFFYRWQGISVIKRVAVRRGDDGVEIRYRVETPPGAEVRFEVMPLLSMRDYHALYPMVRPIDVCAAGPSFTARGPEAACPALRMTAECRDIDGKEQPVGFEAGGDWWHGFCYRVDRARGSDHREDLYAPGWFRTRGTDRFEVAIRAESGAGGGPPATAAPGTPPLERPPAARSLAQRLHQASRQFVVERRTADGGRSHTILAGYPWFGDWGRDAFIALPGLLLLDDAFEEAREVLCTFASAQKDGLVPNRFSDYGDGCDYNSVDASLWFIHAADEYAARSGDTETWERVLEPACRRVVDSFVAGTRYRIFVDDDGLVSSGDATTQLTWMDAKHGDIVFTPRHGKCVEINALWYHGLCALAERAPRDRALADLRDRVRTSFAETFWNADRRCLFDCVRRDEDDARIRPNQILAVSLPHSALSPEQAAGVVRCVEQHLLTPYGLRTLAPFDHDYRGRYEGGPLERDAAYHQGTVWPWLIGPFVEAYLRVHNFHPEAQAHCRSLLSTLVAHLDDAGLGSVSEVFDGDPPHRPGGCFAQAWSVAELRRALWLCGGLEA